MTKNFVRIGIMVAACAFALAGTAGAQLYTEEFNYADTTAMIGTGGWQNHGTTPSVVNPFVVNTPGLSYAGLTVAGNKLPFTTTGQDMSVDIGSAITAPGVIYFSCLLNITAAQAAGDYVVHLTQGNETGTNFHGRIFVRSSGAGYQYGIQPRSTAAQVQYESSVRTFGTTDLLVVRYNMNNPAVDTAQLFINPVVSPTEPGASDLTATSTLAEIVTPAGLNRVNVRQGAAANAPTGSIDEIRVGATWASVLPGGSAVGEWEMYD